MEVVFLFKPIKLLFGVVIKIKNSNTAELIKKKEALVLQLLKGKAPDFTGSLSAFFDDYFCKSYENSEVGPRLEIAKNPYAIVALGGYGRKDQCIHSDVDLLFLFDKSVPEEAEELIKEIVFPLWDIGLEVGYATRSVKDCIEVAGDDLTALSALFDGRFICGFSNLVTKMYERLQKKVVCSRSKKIISMLVEESIQRHLHFGDSSYLLEPNLKKGQGGLRDFHTMLWIAKIKSGLKQTRDLEYFGYLSDKEFNIIKKSIDFIHDVRNRLHYITGKKSDRLHMEYQIKLSNLMKFRGKNGQKPVELFLGKLHSCMEKIKQQHLIFLSEPGSHIPFISMRSVLGSKTKIPGLKVNKRNMLEFISMEAVIKSPALLLKIFVESADKKVPISALAKRIVKDLLYLVDDEFRKNKSIVKDFEYVLASPPITFNILNEMLNTGFLICFIPEFKGIISRIEYNEYHIYPVDKHSIKTVQTAKKFKNEEKTELLIASLYNGLSNKTVLLWACLLHDIGKSESSAYHSEIGATAAVKILKRYGMGKKEIDTVSFLIRNHLFLIQTATRRDINIEETAVFCARKIKDIEKLKLLYLLTIADSISTGPKAWNSWVATLLSELFSKILNVLKKGELATTEVVEIVQHKQNKLNRLLAETEEIKGAKRCIDLMSLRYFLYVPVADMPEHIRLYHKLSELKFVWDIKKDELSNTRIITVCAKNMPGLFSKIAGVLTLNSIDILDVQVYTWKNDIAFDVLRVTPPKDLIFEDEKWMDISKELNAVLVHNINLSAKIYNKIHQAKPLKTYTFKKPLQINVDNDSSDFFSIIEVFSYNFPGLLYSITDILFKCGLDIYVAKIATHADQIADIFYVRNFYGEKTITLEQEESIIKKIKEVQRKSLDMLIYPDSILKKNNAT